MVFAAGSNGGWRPSPFISSARKYAMRGDALFVVILAVLRPGQALLADAAARLAAPFAPTSAASAHCRQQPMTMMATEKPRPRFASREDMFARI